MKVHNRELERLKISLDLAVKENPRNIIVALHFPPDEHFRRLIEGYNVDLCLFGHLHGLGFKDYKDYEENRIAYKLVSCDYLEFLPYKIMSWKKQKNMLKLYDKKLEGAILKWQS